MNVIVSDKSSFSIEIPYKLIETDKTGKRKPLILYLHGFNDYLESFLDTCKNLFKTINAYHLFIQGPYPVFNRSNKGKRVHKWGRSWYLYDGDQKQFIHSMESASQFIQKVVEEVIDQINVERICVIGYSMGGYLAGYFAMTRPSFLNDLIVAGARIKTEVLQSDWAKIKHLHVLAIHGRNDNIVDYKSQRSEIRRLQKNCVSANFKLIDQKHIFNEEYIKEIRDWLYGKGYT